MSEFVSQVGVMFAPLLCLSVLGVVVIVERLVFFICLPAPEKASSFKALMAELEANKDLAKSVRDDLLSFRLSDLQATLERGIHLLRTVAVLSPMVGLLGTVLGMIEAFRDISAITGPVSPNMIADGLWSAMLTTAYGLSIALPTLFAAFLFTRMADMRLASYQKRLNAKSLSLEGARLND